MTFLNEKKVYLNILISVCNKMRNMQISHAANFGKTDA